MKLLLAVFFAAFAVCALLVIFFQMKYGRLTGPNSETAKLGTESPTAKKCRHYAVCSAAAAAVFLIAACAIGVYEQSVEITPGDSNRSAGSDSDDEDL